MKISIAMATYNGAQYIQEQLQSFVDQTRQPDELIITDDCSSDETEVIVQEFAKTAPFTVAFHRNEKNLGYCGNFNAALMKTTGDLVFLSDQDDVWFPEKIEHMIAVAERNPKALILMNDAALTNANLNVVGLTKLGQLKSAGFSMKSFKMGCCCAVRRELLNLSIPIPSGITSHDSWLVNFADGMNAKLIEPVTLQYYRRHGSNESQFIANRTEKVTKFHARFNKIKKIFKKNLSDEIVEQILKMKILVETIGRTKHLAPEGVYESLCMLQEDTLELISFMEARLIVVNKSFPKRFFSVLRFYCVGGYKGRGGFNLIARDIIG